MSLHWKILRLVTSWEFRRHLLLFVIRVRMPRWRVRRHLLLFFHYFRLPYLPEKNSCLGSIFDFEISALYILLPTAEIQLLGAASIKDGLLLLSAATIILWNTVCSTLTNKIHDGQISPIGFSLHVTSSPSLSK